MKLVKIDSYYINPGKVEALIPNSIHNGAGDVERTVIQLSDGQLLVHEDIEYVYAKLTQIGVNR